VDEKRIAFRVSLTALRDDAGEYMGLVAAFDDLSQAMRLQRVLAWREWPGGSRTTSAIP